MKKNRRIKFLIIMVIAVAFVSFMGLSFAYFISSINYSSESTAEVNTATLDSLIYNEGSPIEIIANQDNFAEGRGNRTGTTESSVVLTVNNMEAATYCYNANLIIRSNDYIYSVSPSTPELIVSVSKRSNGGAYSTIVNNLDITEATGTIRIPISTGSSNYKHSITGPANAVVEDKFKVNLTLINLDANQNGNVGHVFDGGLELVTVDC